MLTRGTRVGAYEIVDTLGQGGMGEVYRARDTRLNRDVAVKVLPPAFASDPERLARFEREARVLASLNHTHIAQIYGLEESGASRALVMELVDGEDLAVRIARGRLPLQESLALARQLTQALEAAHDRGIIHRDLKPANIRVTSSGAVKVLDFGLAKALEPTASADIDGSPTITSASTRMGTVLGTAAYMAPEQAKGLATDKRVDIWAFGCVLYEMLAGRAPFPGRTVTETIAAVLEREPDWAALPTQVPAHLRRLLKRCLEKDASRRLHDIGDARLDLDDIVAGRNDVIESASPSRGPGLAVTAATATVVALAAGYAGWALRRPVPVPEARLEITTPPSTSATFAVSPDGLKIVFAARNGTRPQLWLRSIDSSTARVLPGTEGASNPFWSPDSRSIGFFADAKLKRIDVDGGSLRTLSVNAAVPLGGAWNQDGVILFSASPGAPLLRVSATGGESTPATPLDMPRQRGHLGPHFLPGGRNFLFYVTGRPEARGVYVGRLDTTTVTRLFDAAGPAVYASTGHLLFIRDGTLLAQGFDPGSLQLEGEPFAVAQPIGPGDTILSASRGVIAWRTRSGDAGQRQFVRIGRDGRVIDTVIYDDTAALGPALSRDGRRIAVYRYRDGNMDIWAYDLARRVWDRLTVEAGDDIYPLWSPGDSSIVYGAVRNNGRVNIYRRLLRPTPAAEEMMMPSAGEGFPMDWSADGRFLIFSQPAAQGVDLWAVRMDGDRKPFPVVVTEFTEGHAQFSPDAKWIAYQSDRTGRNEVYLRPFAEQGTDVPVSTDGGEQPRWNANGKELFYVAPDDRLMAVPIKPSENGSVPEPGTPAPLFTTNVGKSNLRYRQQYVVANDGQSFIMNSAVREPTVSPISVILNWKPAK